MTARILDTIPDFEKFARKAGLESPVIREQLWREVYHDAHPEVFEAFFAEQQGRQSVHALVRELSKVRMRVKDAAPQMADLINELEPAVRGALGMSGEDSSPRTAETAQTDSSRSAAELPGDVPGASPLHVLMVGTFSTNAFAGKLGDEVAVFHCLEWFSGPEPTRVLIAHEDTHAWHDLILPEGHEADEDLAWTAFREGLAIQVSRRVVPERPEEDYFWYGVAGFEEWLPECRKDESKLLKKFKSSLGKEGAVEAFFGGGFVEKKWRTGYYLADLLVQKTGRSPEELFRMTVDEGSRAIKDLL